jgi:hypothetical protein
MKSTFATLAGIAVFAFSPANAATVFGNLGSDGSNPTQTGGLTDPAAPRNLSSWNFAQGFTVSSPGWIIDSVTAAFRGISTIKLSIYSDVAGSPGAELVSNTINVNNPTITNQSGKVTFNLAPVTLTSGSSYWIVADKTSSEPEIFTWLLAAGSPAPSPSEQNSSGWLNTGTQTRPESGGSWSTITANNRVSISIQATAIPEPGAVSIAALFATGALLRRSRRK